jgi:predicted nucleic acid-binding protein
MSDSGPVVTDSGPIIALAKVGHLDVLGKLFGTVLVPGAVFREVAWQDVGRPGAIELSTASWAVRIPLETPPDALLAGDLGPGEAEAITLAVQRHARLLLLDDRRARRIAEVAYRLRVKGVAGILVAAKKHRLIGSVKSLLLEICDKGYYVADNIIDRALIEAGEKGSSKD